MLWTYMKQQSMHKQGVFDIVLIRQIINVLKGLI